MKRLPMLTDIRFHLALWLAPFVVASSIEAQGAESCRAIADSARRLELPDGRPVSIDVRSIATSGGLVMAVGEHAYVFPRPSAPLLSPARRDFIGVIIDRRGSTALVPSPLPQREVLYPRVAPGPDGSFHALFLTAGDSITRMMASPDTASVWYTRFENGTWRRPEHVLEVRDAQLDPEYTSALLERDGSLTFLMPFEDLQGPATSGGVLMLRRRGGEWISDTLRTIARVTAVRAQHIARGEGVIGLLTQVTGSNRIGEEVFLFQFRSRWSEPRRIGGDGVFAIADRALARAGEEYVATWSRWKPLQPTTNVIEWVRLQTHERLTPVMKVDSGSATYPFELTVIDNRYALWLFRGEPYGSAARLVLGTDSAVASLSQVTMPLENPRPKVVALSGTRFLVFSMKRAGRDDEPMVASYITRLEIRCPRSARR